MNSSISAELNAAKSHLDTLTQEIKSHQQVLQWFQELCNNLCKLLLEIASSIKQTKQSLKEEHKETLLLYLLQLNTKLSVLIKIFMTEHNAGLVINEARHYITHQIDLCLSGLENVLNSNHSAVDNVTGFVKYMDLALDNLTSIDLEEGFANANAQFLKSRKIVEEVLCHAMSIAQVALKEDCATIRGSSKEVLYNLDYLLKELENKTPSVSMCNLYVDYCNDKLCSLERKVNSAVLKLSLKVFSECTKPLDDLHMLCLKNCQNEELLDELIADFDLHVDRMFQVGLFAIACSSDKRTTLRMRNCLASLESLESELIPAMTSLNKDGTSVELLYYAEILKHHWIKQALDLKKYIYLIIDPMAFCQVTYEVIKEINEELEEQFKNVSCVDKEQIKAITLQAKILYEMLLVSLSDTSPENQESIRKYLNDVICVTMEIDAAATKLLADGEEMCKENVLRVFKRCKVQENILKKLLDALKHSSSNINLKEEDKSPTSDDQQISSKGDSILKDLTTRGQELLKERSILYKSPKKMLTFNVTDDCGGKSTNIQQLNRTRNMQFSHSRTSNETIKSYDLQITDILNNLTQMSISFK